MKVSEPDSSLLTLTATEMAARLRHREVSARELVEAHISRIEQTQDDLNAVVVPLFDQARMEAKQADKRLKQDAKQDAKLGPLHGVPITIKEFFDVAGTPTTGGIVSAQHKTASRDAITVAKLRAAGTIILGKTNVPQFGIAIESENPVYGRSSHPLDLERSPGGSSGGEAAIIAAYGSPLGLGSDGGGSIRIPSHCTGICGLKPTSGRLSMQGHWYLPSFPADWATPGPMARSVADLELAMRCLLTPHPQDDPYVPPTSLANVSEVDVSTLRIGYFDDDQFARPSPAVRRAIHEAKAKLKALGATVVPFDPPPVEEAWNIELGLLYADGGKWIRKMLAQSPVSELLKKTLLTASLPTPLRRTLPSILRTLGQTTVARLLRLSRYKQHTAFRYQQFLVEQEKLRRRFLRRWQAEQLDALICPPFVTVAMQHNSPDIVLGIAYTFFFNLTGLPAGVVPMTSVGPDETTDRKASRDDFVKDCIRAETGSVGLPVGVQVVGRLWRDHVALAVMQALEQR